MKMDRYLFSMSVMIVLSSLSAYPNPAFPVFQPEALESNERFVQRELSGLLPPSKYCHCAPLGIMNCALPFPKEVSFKCESFLDLSVPFQR